MFPTFWDDSFEWLSLSVPVHSLLVIFFFRFTSHELDCQNKSITYIHQNTFSVFHEGYLRAFCNDTWFMMIIMWFSTFTQILWALGKILRLNNVATGICCSEGNLKDRMFLVVVLLSCLRLNLMYFMDFYWEEFRLLV